MTAPTSSLKRVEGHFLSRSTELFYQRWINPTARATLVLTHGLGEHSESYVKSAESIAKLGYSIIAWDLRGHGRSSGKRGHVDHFSDYTTDLSQLLLHLQKNGQLDQPFALLAHSMGGLITLKYLIEESRDGASDDPRPKACVLSSPLLGVALKVPVIKSLAADVLFKIWPSMTLANEIQYTDLTRDPEWLKTYPKDSLRHDKISPALYHGMNDAMADVLARADQVKLPIAILAAGDDKIVNVEVTKQVFEKLGSSQKMMKVYEGNYHEIFNDLDRETVFRDLDQFFKNRSGFGVSTMTKAILFLMPVLILAACATTSHEATPVSDGDTQVEVSKNYDAYIERYSAGDVEYAGLYNNFEFKATLLNSDIRKGLVYKRGHYFELSDAQISVEREKMNQEMASETKVVMAFFTPSPKNDNLTDDKAIWRIYLEAGGHRYEGKPKRMRMVLAELQALYPYMTRWATPYEVTFPVPTSAIESTPSKYTVTGPLGSRDVNFRELH